MRWIIPARAGFTAAEPRLSHHAADHPRSRGVYRLPLPANVTNDGSSPLARGLLRAQARLGDHRGIIPARAGFTPPVRGNSPPRTDHPRSRGVYIRWTAAGPPTAGSSPLARGLPGTPGRGRARRRIIPARAGFTPRRTRRPSQKTDHPRSRGVYDVPPVPIGLARGSSPLARGLPPKVAGVGVAVGIIPARAGFTRQ